MPSCHLFPVRQRPTHERNATVVYDTSGPAFHPLSRTLFASSSSSATSEKDSDGSDPNSVTVNPTMWCCPYACGKGFNKSSGRSIRRHFVACFRKCWPGGDRLSEKELCRIIESQQKQGIVTTGFKRWRLRHSTRATHELREDEKWHCPWECGKCYRSTSTRSIQLPFRSLPQSSAAGRGEAEGETM